MDHGRGDDPVAERRLAQGATRPALLAQAARRALVLYALGLLVYAWPAFDLSTLRLLGVLQRIAICSLAGAAIWLSTGTRGRLAWVVGLLAGYWALMVFVPVPGHGAGRLDVDGNVAHYVDRIVLGAHNYARTKTWDPEGLVSTIPAVATVLFGMLAGEIVTAARPWPARLGRLVSVGLVLIACGLVCDLWLPINKKLWTSSFALFMAGLDAVLFAVVCWAADVRGWRRALGPFVVLGMNAIAVYMVSELLDITLNALHLRAPLYATFFAPLAAPLDASLLYAVAYTGLMFAFAWALHRRGWYLKV